MRLSLTLSAPVMVVLIGMPRLAQAAGDATVSPAVVLSLVLLVGAAALAGLAWLVHFLLPKSWTDPQRWIVALVTAPSILGLLVLATSGPGLLQEQLAKILLP